MQGLESPTPTQVTKTSVRVKFDKITFWLKHSMSI